MDPKDTDLKTASRSLRMVYLSIFMERKVYCWLQCAKLLGLRIRSYASSLLNLWVGHTYDLRPVWRIHIL
jgi:hypothetical protein